MIVSVGDIGAVGKVLFDCLRGFRLLAAMVSQLPFPLGTNSSERSGTKRTGVGYVEQVLVFRGVPASLHQERLVLGMGLLLCLGQPR